MKLRRRDLQTTLLALVCLLSIASADQGNYNYNNYYYADDGGNDDGNGAGNDDAVGDDAAAQQYYYSNLNDDGTFGNDDYIKYWTDYAILPKRCIV